MNELLNEVKSVIQVEETLGKLSIRRPLNPIPDSILKPPNPPHISVFENENSSNVQTIFSSKGLKDAVVVVVVVDVCGIGVDGDVDVVVFVVVEVVGLVDAVGSSVLDIVVVGNNSRAAATVVVVAAEPNCS